MAETLYDRTAFHPSELEHTFGDRVHLLDDPLSLTFLARLCARETGQPEVGRLVRRLYEQLTWTVVSAEFPRAKVAVPTRMVATHPEAVYRGIAIDRAQKAVTVGIARAGTVPSQILYETLNEVLDPAGVRQDHLVMSRVTDADGRVTGTAFLGAKMGSDVDGRIVLIPDPMGATGSSMSDAIAHYKTKLRGKPSKIIAMHLIVTPEYLRRMTADHPDVSVYALRYDRGVSPVDAFNGKPGSSPKESGLDEHQYIVPGAGGLGEILNNAWI
ncbi:MAG: uracil phosphoribosyltransferase [Sandaracinaceae bacterium]|jgi:uracil phosphoribosyltransferase|nr:uracil phosphoribosyltransferase [Sandaracinaceae bacterium]